MNLILKVKTFGLFYSAEPKLYLDLEILSHHITHQHLSYHCTSRRSVDLSGYTF
jgi:hypothetical protein